VSLDYEVADPGQASTPETLQVTNNGDSAVPVNVKVAGALPVVHPRGALLYGLGVPGSALKPLTMTRHKLAILLTRMTRLSSVSAL
jgi:hypothetical protein